MRLFYIPQLVHASPGDIITLPAEESRHAVTVLRMAKGDVLQLVNGSGLFCHATVHVPDSKACEVQITSAVTGYGKMPYNLHIAIAPPKAIDRFEWFLEKATEIGVSSITPIFTQNSERTQLNTARLQKVITAAVKQSVKAYHPLLNEPLKYAAFMQQAHEGTKYIAHCYQAHKSNLSMQPAHNYTVLIGPEGDFTPQEVDIAIQQGFNPLSLGSARLRTETAGVYACAELSIKYRIADEN